MLQEIYRTHSVIGTILRIIQYVTTFIIAASIIVIGGITVLYFYYAYDLPNIQTLKDYKPPVVSEAFADDGTKLGEFWIECRLWLPIEAIPRQVINSFIAAEDARFFEHRGVDMLGIGRAMVENIKAGHIVQGGSTITQQITRSILLSSERKVARKIREAILATRIERNLNKEQILELYLNQIYLGNRAYGVKAAARNYFNKTVNDLTLAETAMIAGMPTAPSTDSPVHSIDKAKERQAHVLTKMYEHGFISKAEIEKTLKEPLVINVAGIDKDFNYQHAPYFTEHVRRIIYDKYGPDVLYKGGLKIYTTANIAYNIAAQAAVRHGVEALDKRQGYRGVLGHTEDVQSFANMVEQQMIEEAEKKTIHIPPQKEKEPPPLLAEKLYRAVITGFDGSNIDILVGHKEGKIGHKGYGWARTFNTESAAYDGASYLNDPKSKFKVGDIILVKPLTPTPSSAPPQPLRRAGTTASADRPEGKGIKGEVEEFALAQKPLVQGALFSLDTHSGEVKAMVGGYDFADSEFNRATQSVRQPGSSFKPFIYSSALDKGYKYTTPVMDSPVAYQVGIGQPAWAPKNYGNKFAGPTTFESDIVHSRNVPTVKIAHDIGLHYLTAYIRKMGLTSTIWKYLSMALGANGVYLSEMVPAYSTFAANGIHPTPSYIKKITDSDGKVLEEWNVNELAEPAETKEISEDEAKKMNDLNTILFEQAQKYIETDHLVLSKDEIKILYGNVIPEGYTITPQTAYLMTRLLQEVVDRGTGTRVKALGKPVAGKTGTTNDETDCWFIGFVPDLAAGVWVGFDNIAKIGGKETGGKTAAPIFLEYMKEATKDFEPKDFQPPEGLNPAKIAQLTGGSAVYFRGYSFVREGFGGTQRIGDRAINFFEEDMAGGSSSVARPAPISPPSSSDDGEF